MQHSISCMANSVDPGKPASEEEAGSIPFANKSKYWFRKMKMINGYCQSIYMYMVYVYLNAN